MCGIFGTIGKNKNDEEFKKCLDSIAHRGPDDEGFFQDESIMLGFRRLSIIDLSSRGHQPMANENKTIRVIFNGEIYNYQELKKKLESQHIFSSGTDTEVLIHGYEEWGIEGLLGRINGMYAFCIYDRKNKKIYLVRDRIGKKPLYYYESGENFYFSSETKAFLKLKDFKFEIDKDVFSLWIGFPYLPDNGNTIIKNVKKIPPAHYLAFDLENNSFSVKKYYSPSVGEIKNRDIKTNADELDKLLNDSIKNRLIADVPIGVLLSGGLDSSLITAIASKYKPNLKTINISFPGTITDESQYAQEVARHCQTDHTSLKLEAGDLYQDFKENIWIFDDLSTVDGGLYSTYLLSKKIREAGIKVALVGEGADEVFCGYSWFSFGQLPFRLLGRFINSFGYYYAIMRIFFHWKFIKYPFELNKRLKNFSGSLMTKIQQNEIVYSLPNHYCMKLDKGSSAASIETRAPYLDYRLVDFALSIPDGQKIKGDWYDGKKSNEKYILREVAKKYLPKNIYTRKKKGGMMPTYTILESGLKEYGQKIAENELFREYFSEKDLRKLINQKSKIAIYVWQREWILWKFLVFQIWFEYYYEKNGEN
jgi:asparagine synthase (glutamine-hydrolysing)